MGLASALQALDEGLIDMFTSWNSYSTGLATLLIVIVLYRVLGSSGPDVHPLLLVRQAEHNRIRMPGESPVYGARYTEHLLTGLNVHEHPAPGQRASPWSRGIDGDLRDVWKQTLHGISRLAFPVPEKGSAGKTVGRLVTVLGKAVIEHDLEDIDHQIAVIGQHLASRDARRVAIYLPNSVEFAAALFACSFQLISPILIPPGQSPTALVSMLRDSGADSVVAEPGVFPVDAVASSLPGLRNVVWVVDEGNAHLDWNEFPAKDVHVATWQDIVRTAPRDSTPKHDSAAVPDGVVTFWHTRDANGVDAYEPVVFSHANLVAGIAGQRDALPPMTPNDVVLPAASLADAHTLVVTLTALWANAVVVLNAAACSHPDLAQLTDPAVLCPTIVIASPETLLQAHAALAQRLASSVLARTVHGFRTRTVLTKGRMPSGSTAAKAVISSAAGLRLIVTADHAGAGPGLSPALSPAVLSDLRVATGARIVYAMAAKGVAGAVAQTSPFDYRIVDEGPHFGAPPRCVTYVLKDAQTVRNTDEKYQGQICARGPCVVGKEIGLGVMGTVRFDSTLAYL